MEEDDRPNSSLSSTLPAELSGQSVDGDFPHEITEEEIITGAEWTVLLLCFFFFW